MSYFDRFIRAHGFCVPQLSKEALDSIASAPKVRRNASGAIVIGIDFGIGKDETCVTVVDTKTGRVINPG